MAITVTRYRDLDRNRDRDRESCSSRSAVHFDCCSDNSSRLLLLVCQPPRIERIALHGRFHAYRMLLYSDSVLQRLAK